MKYILPAAVAIGVGLITLMGYFVDQPSLNSARLALVDWALTLSGLAVLIGVLNLLLVHLRKIQAGRKGWPYSLLLVAVTGLVLVLGLLEGPEAALISGSLTHALFTGILVAAQATLASLVLIFLIYAAARMLRMRPTPWTVGFLVVVVIMLVGWLPLSFLRGLSAVRAWLINVPAAAGARGVLIGIALATVVMGVRVLMGIERPYKD